VTILAAVAAAAVMIGGGGVQSLWKKPFPTTMKVLPQPKKAAAKKAANSSLLI